MGEKVPRRFDVRAGFSKEAAQDALIEAGAIILTNLDPTSEWSYVASMVPIHVWDTHELLLERHRADSVTKEHAALKLEGAALPPHSDGYKWGDCFPDLVILVCEEPAAEQNGANYLIDGKAVFGRLTDATKTILMEELIDHTERTENSFTQGAESVAPVFRFLKPKGWRKRGNSSYLCWRRMVTKDASEVKANALVRGATIPYLSLWTPLDTTTTGPRSGEIEAALLELDQAIEAEDTLAPRFVLKRGEALIVDNFRMLHAREDFLGFESKRQMWRVWSWTNSALGLPPEIKPSGEGVPSTILGSG